MPLLLSRPFCPVCPVSLCLFLTGPPPPEPSPLSLHDALPISSTARFFRSITATAFNPAHATNPFDSSEERQRDRKSTRLNSSHLVISYAVFCLKKKKNRRQLRPSQNGTPRNNLT